MSTDTFIEFMYGIPLHNQSESLAEKLAVVFPEFAADFLDEKGKVKDANELIKKLSESGVFVKKFPSIRIQVTNDDYVLIVLVGSVDTLYYKYYADCDGVTLPDQDRPSKKPLKKFAKELNLTEKPQSIIWSYEEDLDDESTWIEKNIYY